MDGVKDIFKSFTKVARQRKESQESKALKFRFAIPRDEYLVSNVRIKRNGLWQSGHLRYADVCFFKMELLCSV